MVLKKQIKIEKWVTAKDSNGDNTETVEQTYTAWAVPRSSGGSRGFINNQGQLNQSVVFELGYRPDWKINGEWRIIYRGERYVINSIEQEDRFKWIIVASK